MMSLIYFIGQLLFLPHLFIYLFSDQRALIDEDLRVNSNFNNKSTLYVLTYTLLINKYFRTLFYFRTRSAFSLFLRIFYRAHASFTIDINSKIGSGLKLAHPYSTIINAESLGRNVYINHLVTIGEKNGKRPIIGDNVEIHANATIIGGIKIEDKVIVGAGAVVVKDVPANSVVVGNPAKQLIDRK